MSNVPRARATLAALRQELEQGAFASWAARVDAALSDLHRRRPNAPVAPDRSRRVTPEIAAAMRAYKAAKPSASQIEIAVLFNCASGRVSEALHHDL